MKKTIKSNLLDILWFLFHVFWIWSLLGATIEAFIFTIMMYSISILIAFSQIGEWMLCLFKGAQKIVTLEDITYLEPLFDEVYEQAKKETPTIPDNIELRIIEDMTLINGYAMGTHTIAITRGAINTQSEDDLKGVIAHEFGHIVNGDTEAVLLREIGNLFFSITAFFVGWILTFFEIMLGEAGKPIVDMFRLILDFFVGAFMFFGDLILSIDSRKNEYRADEYASKIGYNEELKQSLYLMQRLNISNNIKLSDWIIQGHPPISKRIERLENL